MRLWTLSPKYLDTKGLLALWRESLLAKNVLAGNTKGYKQHPQLQRFKEIPDPLSAIDYYLAHIWEEARSRDYNFDANKFAKPQGRLLINVNQGQVNFEREHLLNKLSYRDPDKHLYLLREAVWEVHPLFKVVPGSIESWEKTTGIS